MSSRLSHYLEKLVSRGKTPGISYAWFSSDEVITSYRAGYADVQNRKEITESTSFNAYSVTKTFTAIAVLQLVEEGKMHLNEPVKKFLSSFPYSETITVRNLLTHTSGIPNPVPLSWIHLNDEHELFDSGAFFKKVFDRNSKLKSPPGKVFHYSNLNYILLGQMIEAVAAEKYESFIRRRILNAIDPEGAWLGFNIKRSGHAKGYHKRWSAMNAALGLFINRSKFIGKPEGNWVPFHFTLVNGTAYGGLVGTVNGLVKYVQELLKDSCRFVSSDGKKNLFSENKTTQGKPTGMCLSWFTDKLNGKTFYCHAGGGGGYYCEVRIYPQLNKGSVVMLNRSGMSDERLLSQLDPLMW